MGAKHKGHLPQTVLVGALLPVLPHADHPRVLAREGHVDQAPLEESVELVELGLRVQPRLRPALEAAAQPVRPRLEPVPGPFDGLLEAVDERGGFRRSGRLRGHHQHQNH